MPVEAIRGAEYIEQMRQYLNQISVKAQEFTGLEEQVLGTLAGLVVFLACSIAGLLVFGRSAPKKTKSSKSKGDGALKVKETTAKDVLPSKQPAEAAAGTAKDAATTTPTKIVSPATTSDSLPLSPPKTPPPPSPAKELGSPQVLHSGSLKKRSVLYASVNSFELYQEDDRNIAIFYSSSSTSASNGASPRNAKSSASMYLAPESYIEVTSRTRFTVHQLKTGGKKLQLEAKTLEDRDLWVKKIQDAVTLLQAQKKV